jgi:hypothetical protein
LRTTIRIGMAISLQEGLRLSATASRSAAHG